MPAKYSHVKKRPASRKKQANKDKDGLDSTTGAVGSPHVDRGITQALSAVSKLERTIARILLLRYEQDIARLFSTRLYTVSLVHLPTFVMRCVSLGGPGWAAHNADCDEIKDFFRAAISMDMRQAGERVATKSVLWSYTALRHFAMSNNVHICQKRGLHSLRLLPHYDALKTHLDSLEALPPPQFTKPPHLGPLLEGEAALEEACEIKYGLRNPNAKSRDKKGKNKENENDKDTGSSSSEGSIKSKLHNRRFDFTLPFPFNQSPSQLQDPSQNTDPYDPDWRSKVLLSYEKLVQTLWRVAKEFDVRGYGTLLREKLTTKWCDCGCSTDHLGEVCERTVREEEEWTYARAQHNHGHSHNLSSEYIGNGKGKEKARIPRGKGKQREWDGRGSGVFGWDTLEEEDIWEVELDFGGSVGPGFEHRDGDVSDDDHSNSPSKRNKRDKGKTEHEKEKEREAESISLALGMGMEGFGFEQDLRDMTISEVMEWRYLRAEKEKEAGNAAFRKGEYEKAVEGYEKAYKIEPELPHYQLNIGMAYLKLNNWIKAEEACSKSLGQHKSAKGYFRRAKARKMLGRTEDAARDLRAVLKLQPTNVEAQNELLAIYPPEAPTYSTGSSTSTTQKPNPHIPTLRPPKPLPFSRTPLDDRKMKIVQFPAALDSQVLDLAAFFGGPGGQQGSNSSASNGLSGLGGLGALSGLGPLPPGMSPTNYYYANGYGDGEHGFKGGRGGKGKEEHGPHGHGCTCGNRYRGRGAGAKVNGDGGGQDGNGEKKEKTKEDKEKADRAWKRQKELEKLRATPGMMYPGWERYVVKRMD